MSFTIQRQYSSTNNMVSIICRKVHPYTGSNACIAGIIFCMCPTIARRRRLVFAGRIHKTVPALTSPRVSEQKHSPIYVFRFALDALYYDKYISSWHKWYPWGYLGPIPWDGSSLYDTTIKRNDCCVLLWVSNCWFTQSAQSFLELSVAL